MAGVKVVIVNNITARPFATGPVIQPAGLVIQSLLGVPGLNISTSPPEPIFIQGADTSVFFDDMESYSNAQSFSTIGAWSLLSNFPQLTAPVGSGTAGGKAAQIIWGSGDNFVGLEHAIGVQTGRTAIVTWLYKAQAGFAFSGANVDQLGHDFVVVNSARSQKVIIRAQKASGSTFLRMQLQPNVYDTVPSLLTSLADGAYHQLTLKRVAESSNGASDGSLELWVSGVRQLAVFSVQTGSEQVESVALAGAFNGGSTATQTEAYDRIRVWTSGSTGQSIFQTMPQWDPGNPDYVLHAFEDWSTYTNVSDINTTNRVDGGGHWDQDPAAVPFQSFSNTELDPWVGVKRFIIDYQVGPSPGNSLGHGLNLTNFGTAPFQYLNPTISKDTLIIEWAWRFRGTAIYSGKICDYQPFAGWDRFNYQNQADPPGAQRSPNTPATCDADPLCQLYYTGGAPDFAGVIPLNSFGAEFARSLTGAANGGGASVDGVWFYTQNRGYPSITWANNGAAMLGNTWHRTVLVLTLNVGNVMGRGRIEEYHEIAGQVPIKVQEYIGDVGGFDANQVMSRDTPTLGTRWIIGGASGGDTLHFYNLTAQQGIFDGGSTVDIGYFRMWSKSRRAIGSPEPNYYTRNFATFGNEALISDGAKWGKLGKRDGIVWDDVQCLNGTLCGVYVNTQLGDFADCTALLAGTWAANQEAEGVIKGVDALSSSCNQEIEIRLRSSVSANTNSGYEVNLQAKSSSGHYLQLVKWNGPIGSFVLLDQAVDFPISNGMTLRARVTTSGANAVIEVFLNNVLRLSFTDTSPITVGNPGVGFYISPFSTASCFSSPSAFGFTSFTARELP